jgi:hypothetical protein
MQELVPPVEVVFDRGTGQFRNTSGDVVVAGFFAKIAQGVQVYFPGAPA